MHILYMAANLEQLIAFFKVHTGVLLFHFCITY